MSGCQRYALIFLGIEEVQNWNWSFATRMLIISSTYCRSSWIDFNWSWANISCLELLWLAYIMLSFFCVCTVDGQNTAPVDIIDTPWNPVVLLFHMVQNFVHQQCRYVSKWGTSASPKLTDWQRPYAEIPMSKHPRCMRSSSAWSMPKGVQGSDVLRHA